MVRPLLRRVPTSFWPRAAGWALLPCLAAQPAFADQPPPVTWDWYNAAEIYRRAKPGNAAQLRLAATYHEKAARRGNAASAYKLGEMYENGVGLARDHSLALLWYEVSADGGNRYGMFRVGFLHQNGLGTPKNLEKAAAWYRRSAAMGNPWAFHMLAFMLADGQGMAADRALAIAYFERSLPETDDAWAKWKLATLIAAEQPARARRLMREAAAAGNPEAKKALGAGE